MVSISNDEGIRSWDAYWRSHSWLCAWSHCFQVAKGYEIRNGPVRKIMHACKHGKKLKPKKRRAKSMMSEFEVFSAV